MYQYDDPSVVANLPTPAAAGTPGYFTDGNAAGGSPATILRSDFMNMLMMELLNIVNAAGITPSKTTYNQLLTALNDMYAKIAGSSTQVFSVANATQASHAVALGQFVNSLATSGYLKLPGGLILQWVLGAWDPADTTQPTQALNFPVTFPNAVLNVQVSTEIASASGSEDAWYQHYGMSTAGVSVQRQLGNTPAGAVQTRPHVYAIGY